MKNGLFHHDDGKKGWWEKYNKNTFKVELGNNSTQLFSF